MFGNSDFEDAYSLVLVIADVEDESSSFAKKIRQNWESAVKMAKEEIIDSSFAEKVRRSNHGRKVLKQYLNNPVIIGLTSSGSYIALDGSHRLIEHIENQNNQIRAYIIDISWLDEADDMDFELP